MAQQDKFLFSFVSRGSTVLAEYTATDNSCKSNAIESLVQLGPENKFYSVLKESKNYNFLIQDGFAFVVISNPITSKEMVMFFLDRIRKEFVDTFASNATTAPANSLDVDFGPKMKDAMDYVANNPQEFDKIEKIKAQEQELKGLLQENINKVVNRGEQLSEITRKADELKSDAIEFQTVATQVKNKYWWENFKLQILLAIILLIIIIIVLAVVFS